MDRGSSLYLSLLKRCVINLIYGDAPLHPGMPSGLSPFDLQRRIEGRDWPSQAHSMLGLVRLDNLQNLLVDILEHGIPGDLLEAGAWRGGTAVFMRGVLAALGDKTRTLWVADSFKGGLPLPGEGGISERSYQSATLRAARDPGFRRKHADVLCKINSHTSLAEVSDTFTRYELLDRQVRLLPGYFSDTLPQLTSRTFALLHVDCDLYDSTKQVLQILYPSLASGGYVVVDDYHSYEECRLAVEQFRASQRESGVMTSVGCAAVYWRKQG